MLKFIETAYKISIKIWIRKNKFEYVHRCLQITYMQCWPHVNESFAFISKSYKINSQLQYKKMQLRVN